MYNPPNPPPRTTTRGGAGALEDDEDDSVDAVDVTSRSNAPLTRRRADDARVRRVAERINGVYFIAPSRVPIAAIVAVWCLERESNNGVSVDTARASPERSGF